MSKTQRWVCVLSPCAPGLTLLVAGVVLLCLARDQDDTVRAVQELMASGAVLLAGLLIGLFAAWRVGRVSPGEALENGQRDTSAD